MLVLLIKAEIHRASMQPFSLMQHTMPTHLVQPIIKKSARRVLFSSSAASCLALLLTASHIASAQTYTWSNSGIDGGGYQNAIAIQPGGTNLVISAGDVSGFHRSTDFGLNWKTSNVGAAVGIDGAPHLSSVVFDTKDPDVVYALAGWEYQQAETYGFYASTDGGLTWQRRSQAVQGLAGGAKPRAVGKLIAVDNTPAGLKYIYVASNDVGVKRSTNGGFGWQGMGFGGRGKLRSIVIDPVTPTTVFLAADDGLWRCTNARTVTSNQGGNGGTQGWTRLGSAPDKPEELLHTGSTLYVVGRKGSDGGIWRSRNNGDSFTRLGVGVIPVSPSWSAIAGYRSGSKDTLYIGCIDPVEIRKDEGFATIFRSIDDGVTWTPITLNANINYNVGNASGALWWLSDATFGNRRYMLNGSEYSAAQIVIDPSNTDRVLVAGRSGVWCSINAKAAASSVEWFPRVRGMGVTVNGAVAAGPAGTPNRVYTADADYRFFLSTDGGQTFQRRKGGGDVEKLKGTLVAVDNFNGNGKVYLGLGSPSSSDVGEIFSNENPLLNTDPEDWISEGLKAATGGKEPKGLIIVRDDNQRRVIIVAVAGGGIWRKAFIEGEFQWAQATITAGSPSSIERTSFSWVPGQRVVYCFDQGTGVWRSTDYGDKWVNIWDKPSLGDNSGHVVADPTQLGRIYISTDDGVYRAVNANWADPISPSKLNNGPEVPGPIAFAQGKLFACDLQGNSSGGARMFRWANPATNPPSQPQIISDRVYAGAAGWCQNIAVNSDGSIIYASLKDNGVLVGRQQ